MQTLPRLYRWSRAEYDRLVETGLLEGRRVELIEGKIVEMSPKRPRHSLVAGLTYAALEAAFAGEPCQVRKEDPLALGKWDEPEPNVAVCVGERRDYSDVYPTADQTWLVVEVAETTASFDLGDKADIYAAAGIADYWLSTPTRPTS